jgi:hypothetical protein
MWQKVRDKRITGVGCHALEAAICQAIRAEYQEWYEGPLREVELDYLFPGRVPLQDATRHSSTHSSQSADTDPRGVAADLVRWLELAACETMCAGL